MAGYVGLAGLTAFTTRLITLAAVIFGGCIALQILGTGVHRAAPP
ncbi:hypothetical protein SHIRM173S_03497 [Streptomyces hirsutus]